MQQGKVIKLDRGFPLVLLDDGAKIRCEHTTDMKKNAQNRAVIGDNVKILIHDGHDMGQICAIDERESALVRKDPRDRTAKQVLAANFDWVLIVHPMDRFNLRRLEREMVLAFETGAHVAIVLTKSDVVDTETANNVGHEVRSLIGNDVPLIIVSKTSDDALDEIRALSETGTTIVLMGQSGAGKSTLINRLIGNNVRKTQKVREADGKGRHTTVSREMLRLPKGGWIVDMPGVRGLGLWDAADGISAAFADVEELASSCKFRDCQHKEEPGCAIRQAVEEGTLSQQRLDSYLALNAELEATAQKREEARWSRKK